MPRLKNATACPRCQHTNVKDAEGHCARLGCLCHCVERQEKSEKTPENNSK